jgi:hypothetical protein
MGGSPFKTYRLQLDLFLPDNVVVAGDGGVVQSGPVGLLRAGLLVCRLLRACKQFDLKYSRVYLQRIQKCIPAGFLQSRLAYIQ